MADAIEAGDAVLAASHRFAVDYARPKAEARNRLDDQREAFRQVIAWPAVEAHPVADLAGNDPEATA
jgi:hypothetical protein